MKRNETLFNFIIDEDLKKEFMRKALKNEETASKLLRKYIKNYVRNKR